jgi:DNA invertase Pin-like site-specific DNA recombinase
LRSCGRSALGEGDVLVVTRLDRLARSTRLNVLHEIGEKGAAFKSLIPGPTPRRRTAS